ncbi:unnamed protein product [Camellia sinensis]
MEFHLLPILAFLSLTLVASHATLSPEAYWNSVLPNSPMPKVVKDLLHPEWMEDKSTSVGVGKGGVSVDAGKGKPGGTSFGVGKGDALVYKHAATADQLHDNANIALFFLENDFKKYTKMTLHFTKTTTSTTFLPRQVAEKIPFSSKKMPQILDYFSVKPNSMEAKTIEQTIKECEEPGIKGEEKYCATSLESMVDFCRIRLGKSIQAISTEVKKETPLQTYTIEGVKKMASDATVVCHKQNYAYTVFYCHKTQTTKAYKVSMVGVDGAKAEAVAVCHTDTSGWNPKHLAFQVLKVKPGTVPICHFLPEDHIVWVRN